MMSLWVDCTTSQQRRRQEATREEEELKEAAQVVRQGVSQRGSRKGGSCWVSLWRLLLAARRTDTELKEEGMEPEKELEEMSMLESMGRAPDEDVKSIRVCGVCIVCVGGRKGYPGRGAGSQ
jgi:hypothetical protein